MKAPLFSVVVCADDGRGDALSATVQSVLAQRHQDWEVLLVRAGSADAHTGGAADRVSQDPRVRAVGSPRSDRAAAWTDGLAAARGSFVAFLVAGDLLVPTALAENAQVVGDEDEVDVIYSDEDVVRPGGVFTDAFDKPDWSPERLRSQNYCGQLSVLRASLVEQVGGFRPELAGAEDHDLLLRVTERARRVAHVPRVLCHRPPGRTSPDAEAALDPGRRAVQEHLDRIGVDGTVEATGPGRYRTRRVLPASRRVSIVIPTRGSSSLLWGRRTTLVSRAVRSALAKTRHENLEVVVVHDTPTPPQVLAELREIAGDRLRLVPFDEPFNYSKKLNLGVLSSTGDRLILLNDDVEVLSEDWIEELLAPLEQADVGMTGARLYFSSTAIQHVGLAFSNGRYMHPYRRSPKDSTGAQMSLLVDREVSGVTGACVGIRRSVYLEVGGLTEQLRESFNDVDFCYKVARAGYRTLYLAHCELFHFESQTREPLPNPDDDRFVRGRWGIPTRDPYTPTYPDRPLWADRNANLAPRALRGRG